MRVLIIGEDAPGALARSYAAAFGSLGVEVGHHCDQHAFATALPGAATRLGRRLLAPVLPARANARLLQNVRGERADLVLVLKGMHLSERTIRDLREQVGAPVVNFYPDDPFSTLRSNRLTYGPAVLAAYDACFTFARHLIPCYRELGISRVEYLPFARDPLLHAPVPGPEEPEFDVVFVGNLDGERIRWLEAASRFRLAIFGEPRLTRVPVGSPVQGATFFPAAYGPELARALARGAISLNIMRVQNQGSHNMRSYESPACGAFTLSQWTPELAELFREGVEVVTYRTPDELVQQIQFWLDRPTERRWIAEQGFRRVEHDTYRERARSILQYMGLPTDAPAMPAAAAPAAG